MSKIILKRNNRNVKTLEAFCSCVTTSCSCASASKSASSYKSTAYTRYANSTYK